jgi:hypothetical protein
LLWGVSPALLPLARWWWLAAASVYAQPGNEATSGGRLAKQSPRASISAGQWRCGQETPNTAITSTSSSWDSASQGTNLRLWAPPFCSPYGALLCPTCSPLLTMKTRTDHPHTSTAPYLADLGGIRSLISGCRRGRSDEYSRLTWEIPRWLRFPNQGLVVSYRCKLSLRNHPPLTLFRFLPPS